MAAQPTLGGRRAWSVWGVAVVVYVVAVLHRSSLGVAGLVAAHRFDIGATQLATFTVLQLAVYAAMQVPVGVLLDRLGSRAMLLGGLAMMSAAELAFAFVTTFPGAVLARAVIGAGDAMIFVSVMRLVAVWFEVGQAPLVGQLTGQLGQLGSVLAAAPLTLALDTLGWTRSFALISAVGVLAMVATALLVADSPYPSVAVAQVRIAALARSVRLVWGNPGTKLGLWSHFSGQFSVTVFSLLWGYPFLVSGEGLSPAAAGTLLTVLVGAVIVGGLVMSRLVSRHPYHRSHLVVGTVAAIATCWTVVLLWPGPAPLPLLVVLVCVMAVGGPASLVGFDLARTFTPIERLGRAHGVVNVGGFVASLLTVALIGLLLDLREPRGAAAYDLADFRVAMCAQYPFWLLGVTQVLRYRRKALAHLRRVHPGAVEEMQRGVTFVHPGIGPDEGV